MKKETSTEIDAKLAIRLKRNRGEPVVVTQKGKPVGVLLRVRTSGELERLLMAHSPKLQRILAKSAAQIDAGLGIEHDQFWKEVKEISNGTITRKRR